MIENRKHIIFCFLAFTFCWLTACQEKVEAEYPTIGYLEKLDEQFDQVVSPKAKIEVISTDHNWTEGPVWSAKKQWLIFSDVPENIAYKWTEENGVTIFLNPSGYSGKEKGMAGSNGLTVDQNGNLILCKSGDREIARLTNWDQKPKPIFETIANRYEEKKFNSPNDVVMDTKGNFYFTDPAFGIKNKDLKEMDFHGVFKITPQGAVHLLTKECPTPNGIGLSPDEKTLYVANSKPPLLFAWDILDDHTITNKRILFDVKELWEKSIAKQAPDGMAVNKDGIIFMTGPDGVLIFTPKGKHLGTIKTDKRTSNCTFNEDETILYVTCDDLVLRVKLKPSSA